MKSEDNVKSEDNMKSAENPPSNLHGHKFPYRYIQCILIFFGVLIAFALRVHMSVAVVSMMDNSGNIKFKEFNWSQSEKSYVLSAFLWGYTVTPLPGSLLAKKYGPKICLTVAISMSSMLALLTPLGAMFGGWKAVCALRAISGLLQGAVLTSMHTLLAKWAPYDERGRFTGIAVNGAGVGKILMLIGSGVITSSALGWPGIFYLPGVVGIIWSIIWWFFAANTPAVCKFITPEERHYIEDSINQAGRIELKTRSKDDQDKEESVGNMDDDARKESPTPLKKIIFSTAFFGLLAALCSASFDTWLIMTEIPAFLNGVFGMNIRSSALLSSLPYMAGVLTSVVFLLINNVLVKRNVFSLITRRKIFNTIGDWMPACLLLGLGYVSKENPTLAVGILIASVGSSSARAYGVLVNFIDISPTYAGVLLGICSTFANILSIVAPLIVGIVVTDTTNMEQWRIIFSICSGVLFTGNILFLFFAKSGPL